MPEVITEFDATDITDASIQFINASGTNEPGTPFGCVGSIDGEPETVTIEKRCGIRVVKSKTKTQYLTITVSGHIKEQVARDIFGLSNELLKPGIYAAGTLAKNKDFVFTATAVDEFEDVTKLMAFPKSSNTTGFRIRPLESGVEEIAMLELEFRAYPDELGYFYYEAFVSELDDPTVAEQWHTQFNRELVEAVPSP